jgi:hypothetical protein
MVLSCELSYAALSHEEFKRLMYQAGYREKTETPEEKAEREARQLRQAQVIAEFQGRPKWDRVNWNGK